MQPYFFLGPETNKLNPKILEICLYGRSMGHCAQGLQSWTHHTLIHSFIHSFIQFHFICISFQFNSVQFICLCHFLSVQFSSFQSSFQFFIPFNHSFMHSFIHSFIHSLNHYFIPSFLRPSFLLSFIHSCMQRHNSFIVIIIILIAMSLSCAIVVAE